MTLKYLTRRAHFRIILILSGALALSAISASGQQYRFSAGCESAYRAVLMFRFDEARTLLDREMRSDPENLFPVYLENYIDFLVLFTGEDRTLYEKSREGRERRLDLLSRGDRSSPWYRFCLAEVNLQWAIVRLKFRDYTAAGFELKRANDLFRENLDLYPGFTPDQLGLGIMHALSGLVPENYKWLATLVGFGGTISQGMDEMKGIATYRGDDRFVRIEKVPACIFTALIQATLNNDRDGALATIRLLETDPDLVPFQSSPLILYARASVYMKTGHNDKALEALSSYRRPGGVYPLEFLRYMQGTAELNSLDTTAAQTFREFLSRFRGGNYIASSWQKIAWAALISGDTAAYRRSIRMVPLLGKRDVDEDKQAFSESASGVLPNVHLLTVRLLFDGGYYKQALDTLLNRSLMQYIRGRRDLAEYDYRLGRVYQALDKDAMAIRHYRMAVSEGKGLPQYYAAGAALQMGIIHEQNREFAAADSCFRLCLSMDYEEYRTSLSQKAKAGLSRVRQSQD